MESREWRGYSGAAMTQTWDAGELGCSRLIFELRERVARLAPGEDLKFIALDPGAPIDLPAWCGMTGHELVSNEHSVYVIRRKQEEG
jgi:tRNA 2-thiouridine synthesizing protein A